MSLCCVQIPALLPTLVDLLDPYKPRLMGGN